MLDLAAALVLYYSPCDSPVSGLLSQDYETFDQSDEGWQGLALRGCHAQAAALIEAYRAENQDQLNPSQDWHLVWHTGQMHAYAGNYSTAVASYEATRQINRLHNRNTQLKTDAVIAFLERDLDALEAVRDELRAMPEPAGFQQMVESVLARYPEAEPPSWPPELARVEAYIRCFEDSYAVAYEDAC